MCLLIIGFSRAQDFENKGNYMSVGVGTDLFVSHADDGFAVGPFLINYERGITDIIGIGRFGRVIRRVIRLYENTMTSCGMAPDLFRWVEVHIILSSTFPKWTYAGAGLGGHFSDTDYYGRSFELK